MVYKQSVHRITLRMKNHDTLEIFRLQACKSVNGALYYKKTESFNLSWMNQEKKLARPRENIVRLTTTKNCRELKLNM